MSRVYSQAELDNVIGTLFDLRTDWQRERYLNTLHPDYRQSDGYFKVDHYTTEGYNRFRDLLLDILEALDVEWRTDVKVSDGYGPDLYVRKREICVAISNMTIDPNYIAPTVDYETLHANDMRLITYRQENKFYYTVFREGKDYYNKTPYGSRKEAIEAGIVRLIVLDRAERIGAQHDGSENV